MALQDEMTREEAPNEENLQRDLNIAVLLAQNLIDDGGIDVITQAVEQSRDPAQVIGQFLMQLASQMEEMLPEHLQLDKQIFLAPGGWVEQISDYLQEQYGISREIMDRAEIYIGTTAQAMAEQKAPPPGASAAAAGGVPASPEVPVAAPVIPQQGAV